ncbi:SusD/RagB family nutrient-binding outer membrane lipoprotein [Sphingobacterium sp. SG20118]|uniref:SusD/RagB family nutrient-binding outer membrane lipoprotein n=1 Tax=Sphingobacterium sp. SG20118 TaxID=3367156 RepID=UPI0037DFC628
MNNLIKKISIPVSLMALIISGCTKDFEKINTNPDALDHGPPLNILANVFRNTGQSFGGDVDGYGTFAGYIVKIQYMDYMSGLVPTNNTFGNRWYACYYNNTQLKDLLVKTESTAEGNKNVRFLARIWQNYMWSYLTDGWRDVPFTEAIKGTEAEGNILMAKYDKQEDIYPAILADLKKIADEMAEGFGTDEIGTGDVIYQDNSITLNEEMIRWQKFCNSLRLRLAMRISGVAPELARKTIEEIATQKDKYPVMETNEDNCYLRYPGAPPYYEPWYDSGIVGNRINNWSLSDIFIDHLLKTEDPRIASIAQKANDGEYRGYPNGAKSGPSSLTSVSWIGDMYMNKAAGSTPFYKSCETYYILAEAAMLGYNVGISAEDAYEKAVKLSMDDNGVSEKDVAAYLEGAGKFDQTKERIWWDMWVALFKENFESWSLYRRTGIPSTNYPSLNSIYGKEHNDQPWRLPYPNNEFLNNKANVEAAASKVKDFVWGEQMWWDKRTGKF